MFQTKFAVFFNSHYVREVAKFADNSPWTGPGTLERTRAFWARDFSENQDLTAYFVVCKGTVTVIYPFPKSLLIA